MRDYGRVYTKFWVSPDIMSLSDDAKLLALYLLTGQHSNALGCFRLPSGYVAADLGFNPLERVSKGFDELLRIGFVTLGKGDWILLPKYLKFNAPENPNVGKMVVKLFEQIPQGSGLIPYASRAIVEFPKNLPTEFITLCKGFSKPFQKSMPNQHETPEPEPEPEPDLKQSFIGDKNKNEFEFLGVIPADEPKKVNGTQYPERQRRPGESQEQYVSRLLAEATEHVKPKY